MPELRYFGIVGYNVLPAMQANKDVLGLVERFGNSDRIRD
jgi:hypothetical protein